MKHPIVIACPDWQRGPISGGHRYNGDFASAIPSGRPWQRIDVGAAHKVDPASWLIVDSLWQKTYESLIRSPRPKTALLVHLLPQMTGDLSFGDASPWPWLRHYQHYLVTGDYAARYLEACGVPKRTITLIEPMLWPRELGPKELGPKELGPKELRPKELGPKELRPKELRPKELGLEERQRQRTAGGVSSAASGERWLSIGSFVPRKGQLLLLRALKQRLEQGLASAYTNHNHATMVVPAQWQLFGSFAIDRDYGAACRDVVRSCPQLSRLVRFEVDKPMAEAERALEEADLLISGATCETFGMAVGEAAALGVPVVAVAGGNIPALLAAAGTGHRVVASPAEAIEAALEPRASQPAAVAPASVGHSRASFAAAVAAFTERVLR